MTASRDVPRLLTLLAGAALLVGSCGQAPPPAGTPAPTGGSTAPLVARDLRYASAPAGQDHGWHDPLLDVYRPPDADGAPVVVLFHGGPANNRKDSMTSLARDLAAAGLVVFVPTWGSLTTPPELVGSVGRLGAVAAMTAWRQEGSCAVSYAVSHAAEQGGDASRLLLFGFSAGANESAAVAMTGPEPFPGCLVPTGSWTADREVLWEGDWLLAYPEYWDILGASLPSALAAASAWSTTPARAVRQHLAFVTSDSSRATMKTCAAGAVPRWLRVRDPSGTIPAAAARGGMLADGCLDVGEEADLLAAALRERGARVTSLDLHGAGSSHGSLAVEDQALVMDLVRSLLGPSSG